MQFYENLSFLLERSPGSEYLVKIDMLALSGPGVLGVQDLKVECVGPDVDHAGMHIEVQSGMTVDEPDHIAEEVDQQVHLGDPSGYRISRDH